MVRLFILLGALLFSAPAFAQHAGVPVSYRDHGVELEGYLARPPISTGQTPTILLVHTWMGLNDEMRQRADQLAVQGYQVFAVDIYGKNIRPKNQKEAAELATHYKDDPQLMRSRMLAAYDYAREYLEAQPKRMAAIGFCFGGGAALEALRGGIPLAGVVTFHGTLATSMPAAAHGIKSKILVLHGADDPYVPQSDVQAFMDEMKKAGADVQVTLYSGTVHSFTNQDAGDNPASGAAYNPKNARRAFQAMQNFFTELFQPAVWENGMK